MANAQAPDPRTAAPVGVRKSATEGTRQSRLPIGQWDSARPDAGWGDVRALIGVGCTIAASFYGWTLIQHHHVGVELTSAQARLEGQPGDGTVERSRRVA